MGFDFNKDELLFYLNKTLDYIFYIHYPDYFIENFIPRILPINYFKVFPFTDCNKYASFHLIKHVELSTPNKPCENDARYSFKTCVEDSIGRKVGCSRDGVKHPLCSTVQQYR